VTVGQGGGRDLRADLYRPPVSNGAAVLLIHGGSFTHGDRSQLRGYGIVLGRVGYTCGACEYRLAGEARWPAQESTDGRPNGLEAAFGERVLRPCGIHYCTEGEL
jgi:hypothetical protein